MAAIVVRQATAKANVITVLMIITVALLPSDIASHSSDIGGAWDELGIPEQYQVSQSQPLCVASSFAR
jgi:hypothetical protein